MDKQQGKRVTKTGGSPEGKNPSRFTQSNTKKKKKKYQIGKLQVMMASMDSDLKKFTSILDRLTLEMNRCLEAADMPERMTKEKTHPDPGRSPKKEPSQTIIGQ